MRFLLGLCDNSSLMLLEMIMSRAWHWQVPSLFQAGRVSKPADSNVTHTDGQQCTSDEASLRQQNAVLNTGKVAVTEESGEQNFNTNAMSVDEISAAKVQNGESLNAVSTCSASSSANVSDVAVVSSTTEQPGAATAASRSAQTSKGVVIRPITTTSETNGKE